MPQWSPPHCQSLLDHHKVCVQTAPLLLQPENINEPLTAMACYLATQPDIIASVINYSTCAIKKYNSFKTESADP